MARPVKNGAQDGVEAAVRADLAVIAKRDPALAKSALAATALALGRELDGPNSATSKSMCAKALVETMQQIRALAPEEHKQDRLDELTARREKRLRTGGPAERVL